MGHGGGVWGCGGVFWSVLGQNKWSWGGFPSVRIYFGKLRGGYSDPPDPRLARQGGPEDGFDGFSVATRFLDFHTALAKQKKNLKKPQRNVGYNPPKNLEKHLRCYPKKTFKKPLTFKKIR